MISPEVLRRYPFFAGLNHEQLVTLAKVGDEVSVETGHYFFHEGEEMSGCFHLILEGSVAIVVEVPDQAAEQKVSGQLTGELKTKDMVVSALGPGEVFGWSALVSPYKATAGAKATTPCRVVQFDCQELHRAFEEDCRFGYLMMQKAAQVIRERLHDMRIESLAHMAE